MAFAAQQSPSLSLEISVPAFVLPDVLPDNIATLKALLQSQQAAHTAAIDTLKRQAQEAIQRILEQVVLARHRQFGPSSEQMAGQSCLFNGKRSFLPTFRDLMGSLTIGLFRKEKSDGEGARTRRGLA